ncbi:hypothetical protein ES703_92825 [subsurface metagenome]
MEKQKTFTHDPWPKVCEDCGAHSHEHMTCPYPCTAFTKLEAVRTWMEEEWSNMNTFWQLDITTHEHPRWKLKEILEVEG